jgi:hypothetical protein
MTENKEVGNLFEGSGERVPFKLRQLSKEEQEEEAAKDTNLGNTIYVLQTDKKSLLRRLGKNREVRQKCKFL